MDLNEFKLLSEINPEDITKVHKINIIFKFMNIKAAQPNLTQEQICKKLGISSSTIKRIRQDLNVKSPYRYDVPLKSKKSTTAPKNVEIKINKETKKLNVKKIKEKVGYGDNKLFDVDKAIEEV